MKSLHPTGLPLSSFSILLTCASIARAVLFSVLVWFLILPIATVAYDYPLYPYATDYSQTMTYKLMLDWGGGGPAKSRDGGKRGCTARGGILAALKDGNGRESAL